MTRELELKVLEMIEEILPKTTMRNNTKLISVINSVRQHLEAK